MEQKPLSVLERFRQLSQQKMEQEIVESSGDVGAVYLMSEKGGKSTGNKAEGELTFHNRRRGFRDRGGRFGKRSFDRHSKPPIFKIHHGLLESEMGITEYVTPGPGFRGIIKQRYSDFQVNEIDLAGNVVTLTNSEIPADEVLEEELIMSELDLLTKEQWDSLREMCDAKTEDELKIDVNDFNKEKRLQLHLALKKKFGVHIYSNTVNEDDKRFMKIGFQRKTDRRTTWPRSRGEHLHFVVHKENTDTTDTIHILAHHLKIKANKLCYAGTKDKRAVTSQRMCVRRVAAEKLKRIHLRNIYVGNFDYKWNTIRLGDLKGNKFRIAVREVDVEDEVIGQAVTLLTEKGFLNYFGTQRFGSSAVAPTHAVGRAIMQCNWKQAVELILKPRPNEKDHADLSSARKAWWETRDAGKALECLHFSNKSIEGKILQALDKLGQNAYMNALEHLPKNTVSLYAHAYQSLIWNKIISRRVKEFGLVPIAGDLVFDSANTDDEEELGNVNEFEEEEQENDDKDVEDDKESKEQSRDEARKKRLNVRVLSEAEAKETSIFDIVYPVPGFDITYPNNATAQWYADLLAEDGLTSETLRQNNRLFSLYGSYRKLLNKPTDVSWKTLRYTNHNKDLIVSDRASIKGVEEPVDLPDGKYKALIVEFNLTTSAYATMALREMLKCETASFHQAALTAKTLNLLSPDTNEESPCKKQKLDEETSAGLNGNSKTSDTEGSRVNEETMETEGTGVNKETTETEHSGVNEETMETEIDAVKSNQNGNKDNLNLSNENIR